MDSLEDKVAVAADAAATAAAHAVAAAKAAEEISKAREEAAARTNPDLVQPAPDAETERSIPTSESPANADEEFGDLLNLDAPNVEMPSVFTRLALIALCAAAAIFVVSFILVTTVPKGTVFDIIVLVTWLGVGVLSLGGIALLAVAGITKVIKSGD